MISVLVPSRERASLLAKSIESLGKGNFEVLVWVDDDDPQLRDYAKLPITMYVNHRVGYKNFHRMINFLARMARGDWLLLWNDDMQIISPNWVKAIEFKNPQQPQVLNFWDAYNNRNNLAPVVSKAFYDAIGHFSRSTHCDSWVQDIANELFIHHQVYGIEVRHLREVLTDETKTNSQSVYTETSPAYDSDEMLRLRNIDIRKLRDII